MCRIEQESDNFALVQRDDLLEEYVQSLVDRFSH